MTVVAATIFTGPVGAATASAPAGDTYVAVLSGADGDLGIHRFRAPAGAVGTRLERITGPDRLVGFDLDKPVRLLGTPDPYRAGQWALDVTSFESAWGLGAGREAVVAVLDTGVDATHEDLGGKVSTGWDVISGKPGATSDPHGHGTHVAGIIAAIAGNGRGISGAAPGVRILPVRVLDAGGSGRLADVLLGIIWAADQGVDVINISVGSDGPTTAYAAAVSYAKARGAVVVAAAGNRAMEGNLPVYPAADPGVIAVGATTRHGERASFSNHGAYLELSAPGASIASTVPRGYATWSGTSMATPYAAATAAMVAAAYPDLLPEQIRDVLYRSARDLGAAGRDDHFGAGLIDPVRVLSLAGRLPGSTSPPAAPAPGESGYWVVFADGVVRAFGTAPSLGDASHLDLGAPIVAAAGTPSGRGYWLASADGGVFTFGDALFYGSLRASSLNAPIVGMTATPSGKGYWLLGEDGGIFAFGDALFAGSTGAMRLNQPVVDMAATPSGAGYWLVGADGGVFTFGDAAFAGSTGHLRLNRPVVSMTPCPAGAYWLIAADGGVFAFDAPFHGSLPELHRPNVPEARRVRATAYGGGYYVLGTDGQVYAFGAAVPAGDSASGEAVDLILTQP